MMRKVWTTAILAASVFAARPAGAVECLNEGFDDIMTLAADGWVQVNTGMPAGTNPVWFQGNDTVFASHSGATTSYIAANFNSVTGANTISNWLLTPVLDLTDGDQLTFFTRTVDNPMFPDRLQVRMSLNGASTDVGADATQVGDFTTILLEINPGQTTLGYPNAWTMFTATVAGVTGTMQGRLAFRHFVTNGGPNGANSDFIGVDTVTMDCAVPVELSEFEVD